MQLVAHQPHRVLIIFNPIAGQAESLERDIHAARELWIENNWQVDVQPTSRPGDGTRIAREAAAHGYDIVVAAGGDGTVNEVVNGLANTKTALAALPVGTVNVWVREIGMPLQPKAAAQAILDAQIRKIDLGRAGDRYFLLMCGIGIDAAVTAEVRPEEKRKLGVFAYIKTALSVISRYRGTLMRITVDGKPLRRRVLLAVLGNSQLYGGVVKITARASLDDGLLDVCLIKGGSLWGAPLRIISLLLQRKDQEIEYHRARTISISARSPLPIQVDGDHIGSTPMDFAAAPGALYALLPKDMPEELLGPESRTSRYAWRRVLSLVGRLLGRKPVERDTADRREHVLK